MKTLKETIEESYQNEQINESFLSVGLSIIVALILSRLAIKTGVFFVEIAKAIKKGVQQGKEFISAIRDLDALLAPYKEQLLQTEFASKLYTREGLIDYDSLRKDDVSVIYMGMTDDIKNVLSPEDFDKYEDIIRPIADEQMRVMKKKFRSL